MILINHRFKIHRSRNVTKFSAVFPGGILLIYNIIISPGGYQTVALKRKVARPLNFKVLSQKRKNLRIAQYCATVDYFKKRKVARPFF